MLSEKITNFFKSLDYRKVLQKLLLQLLFIFIFSILFISDDYIFKFFNEVNKVHFLTKYYSLALVLSVLILLIYSKKLIYSILIIMAFIELTQLIYLSYFGTYLHPTIIPLIFEEVEEISETGFASTGKVYYAFLSVLIPYGIMIFLIRKYHNKLFSFKFAWILLFLFISLLPLRAIREVSIAKLSPNPQYPSLYNGLRMYSAYLFNILPSTIDNNEEHVFKDYKVKKEKPINDKMNLVLIYGESFNYYNQSLYGYNKNTTPNLLELSKKDKNFVYKKGISTAVSTQQSIPTFFNLQREPKNYRMQAEAQLNLFKLAKEQGFRTIFISAQSSGLMNNLGRQYIDVFITLEDERGLFEKNKDEALLQILKQQKLTDKNFIVLHQRNLHSPYEKNYSHRKKEFSRFDNSYDNAMLYNDFILNQIIEYFKANSKIPLYLFITSDHNELTGQNGLFGHITLVPEGGDVPIMLYTENNEIKNNLKDTFRPTHHELGLLIAKIMGYTITNPNTPDNVFYINGNDTMARYGYIKVIKDLENKKVNYEIIDFDKVKNIQRRF